jgi:hypothetical protein
MAINFTKKAAPSPSKSLIKPKPKAPPPVVEEDEEVAVEEDTEEEVVAEEEDEDPPPKKLTKPAVQSVAQGKPLSKKTAGLSFVKRGSEAKKAMEKEEVKAEIKAKGFTRRFWIPENGESKITFLDGAIVDGMFDIPFFYQHTVFLNGSYNNHFICTNDEEPCPICEGGDTASYVGALSIICHDEWKSKTDGKTYKDQLQLFIAKRQTIKILLKAALKRGGLTGYTVDVSRSSGKSAGVGDVFDFSTEKRTIAELHKAYGNKEKIIKPFNYDEVLAAQYITAKDLRKMGFGSSGSPVGNEPDPSDDDYDDNV